MIKPVPPLSESEQAGFSEWNLSLAQMQKDNKYICPCVLIAQFSLCFAASANWTKSYLLTYFNIWS